MDEPLLQQTLKALADAIEVHVKTAFLTTQKNDQDNEFVFSYTITIMNHSNQTVQLIARDWLITDANGKVIKVQGKGVVGQQPVLLPNTSYCYSSGAIINTPVGTMQGHYQMVNDDGFSFSVEIPIFRLAVPNILN